LPASATFTSSSNSLLKNGQANNEEIAKPKRVQFQIDQVTYAMDQNIQKLLERGERIDQLDKRGGNFQKIYSTICRNYYRRIKKVQGDSGKGEATTLVAKCKNEYCNRLDIDFVSGSNNRSCSPLQIPQKTQQKSG
jgi:hypothetical protein